MISITLIIIILTVATSLWAFNNSEVFRKSLMNPFLVFHKKQYWRMLTSGFIHGSYIHLGFNMFTFYFFGLSVEYTFQQMMGGTGLVVFVLFYLSAIVISDLPTAFKQRNNLNYNSLGASGAVSALVFASIIYYPLNKIYLFGILGIPGFILGILYVLYSYFSGKNMSDNINHEAHLYGSIYGIIFAIAVSPGSVPEFFRQISTFKLF